ncbi:MAG: DUF5330 domain-containing protein [Alphaproteobacteria bacterium]
MFRLFLFLFIVAMLVPEGWLPAPPHVQSRSESSEAVGLGEMMAAIDQARQDIGGLCERQPEVCDMGARLTTQVRERALTWTAALAHWLEGLQDETRTHPVAHRVEGGRTARDDADYGV